MRSFLAPAFVSALLACLLPTASLAQSEPGAGIVRVRMTTSDGAFVVAVDTRRAPQTSANFLAYVDDGRFDGTSFYRSLRIKSAPQYGFVQGGIRTDARRILPPFAHEPTSKTGILHLDGTISMARRADPASAGGNYFITVGAMPSMDAHPGSAGYAAFGRVISGMPTIRRILAERTGGGRDAMKDQMILRPVRVISAKRLDGKARPTGYVKPWLVDVAPAKPAPRKPAPPASK